MQPGVLEQSMSNDLDKQFSREGLAELRHRLRTPPNHILGYSEMLLQDLPALPAPLTAELQVIHQNGQEMLDNLQTFLSSERAVSIREVDEFRTAIIGHFNTSRELWARFWKAGRRNC